METLESHRARVNVTVPGVHRPPPPDAAHTHAPRTAHGLRPITPESPTLTPKEVNLIQELRRAMERVYKISIVVCVLPRVGLAPYSVISVTGFPRITLSTLSKLFSVVCATIETDVFQCSVRLGEAPHIAVNFTIQRAYLTSGARPTAGPSVPPLRETAAAAAAGLDNHHEYPGQGLLRRLWSTMRPSGARGTVKREADDITPDGGSAAMGTVLPARTTAVVIDAACLMLEESFEELDRDDIEQLIVCMFNMQERGPLLRLSYEKPDPRDDPAAYMGCYVLCFEGFRTLSRADLRTLNGLHEAVYEVECFANPDEQDARRGGAVRVYFKAHSLMTAETRQRAQRLLVGDGDGAGGGAKRRRQ